MPKQPIEVRRAESVADYRACQEAQRRSWGITEENYVVPVATMIGAQLHGGLVLGAFLPDGTAAGMSFAFLGRTDGRLCLYSQLTGVVPGYQDQGIGGRLKTTQREIARGEGVPCIAWAFDPLQAGNAWFNLEKLKARVNRYVENMYGERSDSLNRNSTTDRLIAVWETEIDERKEINRVTETHDLPHLIDTTDRPRFVDFERSDRILIEIPLDITTRRNESPESAENWTLAVREAFLNAFSSGYEGVGFIRQASRGFYLLQRRPKDNLK